MGRMNMEETTSITEMIDNFILNGQNINDPNMIKKESTDLKEFANSLLKTMDAFLKKVPKNREPICLSLSSASARKLMKILKEYKKGE